MGNYYYEGGANHFDHHKEVTINMESTSDVKSILREILADDIEDIDYEIVGDEGKVAEQSATMGSERPAANNSGGGRKPDSLFKDETITNEWVNIFTAFLNKHNKTGCQNINSRRDNYINKAIVAFLLHWKKIGLLTIDEGNFKGRPCFKFLTENCGKESEISIETYNTFFINCMKDKEYIDKCKGLLVEDFINEFRVNS